MGTVFKPWRTSRPLVQRESSWLVTLWQCMLARATDSSWTLFVDSRWSRWNRQERSLRASSGQPKEAMMPALSKSAFTRTSKEHRSYNCNYHYTTQTTLYHSYNSNYKCNYNDNCATPHYMQQLRWGDHYLWVDQWIRSAIRDKQQSTSLIGFLGLKLRPPPCAALLVCIHKYIYIHTYSKYS